LFPAKDKEIVSLNDQVEELTQAVDQAASVHQKEFFQLQSQFNELQRQHIDILEQSETTVKLREEEMKRLYSEIGECAVSCLLSFPLGITQ